MIKKLFISLVLILLLVAGGMFFYFDSLVKSGIQVVGSQALGTAVTVDSVSISPINGQGSLSGLRVENPEGFDSQYAFELDSVTVNVNVSSVFTDVIEIESITIVQPVITYETKITTDNIRALLSNLASGGSAAGEEAESGEVGKQLIIREFRILDSQLNFVAAVVTAPIQLADIEISNIGAEGGSTSVANAVRVVLAELSRTILSSELPSLDLLRESVEAKLQDGVQKVEATAEDLGGRLRNILNKN
jgi:hypothetical protein